jgi:hypothetical protein
MVTTVTVIFLALFGWGTADFIQTIARTISGGYLSVWGHALSFVLSMGLILFVVNSVEVVAK